MSSSDEELRRQLAEAKEVELRRQLAEAKRVIEELRAAKVRAETAPTDVGGLTRDMSPAEIAKRKASGAAQQGVEALRGGERKASAAAPTRIFDNEETFRASLYEDHGNGRLSLRPDAAIRIRNEATQSGYQSVPVISWLQGVFLNVEKRTGKDLQKHFYTEEEVNNMAKVAVARARQERAKALAKPIKKELKSELEQRKAAEADAEAQNTEYTNMFKGVFKNATADNAKDFFKGVADNASAWKKYFVEGLSGFGAKLGAMASSAKAALTRKKSVTDPRVEQTGEEETSGGANSAFRRSQEMEAQEEQDYHEAIRRSMAPPSPKAKEAPVMPERKKSVVAPPPVVSPPMQRRESNAVPPPPPPSRPVEAPARKVSVVANPQQTSAPMQRPPMGGLLGEIEGAKLKSLNKVKTVDRSAPVLGGQKPSTQAPSRPPVAASQSQQPPRVGFTLPPVAPKNESGQKTAAQIDEELAARRKMQAEQAKQMRAAQQAGTLQGQAAELARQRGATQSTERINKANAIDAAREEKQRGIERAKEEAKAAPWAKKSPPDGDKPKGGSTQGGKKLW